MWGLKYQPQVLIYTICVVDKNAEIISCYNISNYIIL